MFFVDAPFPPGTIVVLSHELSRYADFSISLLRMQAPAGSNLHWNKGVEIAFGLNTCIRQMSGEWLFILGDDHAFRGDILMQLLEDDLDIVVPLCASRAYPFHPVIYPSRDPNGGFKQAPWTALPQQQIFEVAGAGSAGMLIKKRVLDALGDPWFVAGHINRQMLSEDLSFCARAREQGFKVHVDSRYAIGHITPATIWPGNFEGQVTPLANLNGDETRWLNLNNFLTLGPPQVEPAPDVTGLVNE